jgi:long-chain fatty acid transport protein
VTITNGEFTAYQIPTNLLMPANPLGIPAGTPIDALLRSQFTGTGQLAVQSASTGLMLPDQLVIGAAVRVAPRTTVFADYQWVHWGLFDRISIARANVSDPITMTEDYRNTSGVRIGVEHELRRFILRGGLVAHGAAAPDQTVTPLLPEASRIEGGGGIGVRLSNSIRADLAYIYLSQSDRRGRTVSGDATANSGKYAFTSNLFGLTMTIGY